MGWVGPLLKQCSYGTYDANKLSVRAGGGDVVTARLGLAKFAARGACRPRLVGGWEVASPALDPPARSRRRCCGSGWAASAQSRAGCGARGALGVPEDPEVSGCSSASCC